MKQQDYTYYAFISYSHEDKEWARWLHNEIENYRLPTIINKEYKKKLPQKVKPIFRDMTELSAGGDLKKTLHKELQESKYLIVICSLKSAKSEWVNKEIQDFIDMGREDRILPFIVEGHPNSNNQNECFPPALKGKHLLGSSVCEVVDLNGSQGKNNNITKKKNKEICNNAKLKIIAGLLDIKLDVLIQRDKIARIKKRKWIIFAASLLFILFFFVVCFFIKENEKIENLSEVNIEQSIKINQKNKEVETLHSKAELLEILANGEEKLEMGEREEAFFNAQTVITNYKQEWTDYVSIISRAELLLQRAYYISAYSPIGTINSAIVNELCWYNITLMANEEYIIAVSKDFLSVQMINILTSEIEIQFEVNNKIKAYTVDEEDKILFALLSDNSVVIFDLNSGQLKASYLLPEEFKFKIDDINSFKHINGEFQYIEQQCYFVYQKPIDGKNYTVQICLDNGDTTVSDIGTNSAGHSHNGSKSVSRITYRENYNYVISNDSKEGGTIEIQDKSDKVLYCVKNVNKYIVDVIVDINSKYLMALTCDDSVIVYDIIGSTVSEASCRELYIQSENDDLFIKEYNEKTHTLLLMDSTDMGCMRVHFLNVIDGYYNNIKLDEEVHYDSCFGVSDDVLALRTSNKIILYSTINRNLYDDNKKVDNDLTSYEYIAGQRFISCEGYCARQLESNIIELYNSITNNTYIVSFNPDVNISAFTIDIKNKLIIAYSYKTNEILFRNWESENLKETLAIPWSYGATSIQISNDDKHILYVINGAIVYKVDLVNQETIEELHLDGYNAGMIITDTFLIDEENDRIYAFAGDETSSYGIKTLVCLYQFSTGKEICRQYFENNPHEVNYELRYCLNNEYGIDIVNPKDNEIVESFQTDSIDKLCIYQ